MVTQSLIESVRYLGIELLGQLKIQYYLKEIEVLPRYRLPTLLTLLKWFTLLTLLTLSILLKLHYAAKTLECMHIAYIYIRAA